LFLCSPGNPTGTLIPLDVIRRILSNPKFKGIAVVDEAYIDFAPEGSSATTLVQEFANVAVSQTLSKGFGLAGIRSVTLSTGCLRADDPDSASSSLPHL
jgi:histidinol-phosphate aminotransferase